MVLARRSSRGQRSDLEGLVPRGTSARDASRRQMGEGHQEQRWEQVCRQTCSTVSPGLLEIAPQPGECSTEEDIRIRSGWKRPAIESETYDSSRHLRVPASSTGLEIQV